MDKTDVSKEPEQTEEQTAVENPVKNAESEAKVVKKRKVKKSVPKGRINIFASFNNTIITITDPTGNVLVSASAGSSGFKGTKKGTAYAAQIAAESAVGSAKQQFGMSKADVIVKGIGMGREAAVRSLGNTNLIIESLSDSTGAAHGG